MRVPRFDFVFMVRFCVRRLQEMCVSERSRIVMIVVIMGVKQRSSDKSHKHCRHAKT